MGDPSARKARVTGGLVLRVVRPRWGLGPHRSRAALWTLDRDLVSTEEPAAGGLPNLGDGHLGFWDWSPPQLRRGPAECGADASREVLRLVTEVHLGCLLRESHSRICVLPFEVGFAESTRRWLVRPKVSWMVRVGYRTFYEKR